MKITNHLLDDPKVGHGKSPNVGGTITPTIIVLHYTASGGEDGQGDADYLSRAAARASAQVVVGRNGSIDQIVPFNKKAWHAGVSSYKGVKNVNDFSIGIEIDNWGWLKNGKSHAGVAVKDVFKGTRSGHSEWEAYNQVQLDAVEQVIAAICSTYKITDIVGHEDIAPGRKQDPGPALDAFKAKMKEKYVFKKEAEPATAESKASPSTKTTENLNLRGSPNKNSVILTTIPKGRVVEVLDPKAATEWAKVKFGTRVGFVNKSYLT
jgi:N-acetylmuramoyl-L-alanine amidase